MRSKQQPRPSFRWPQQRGDNLTGKYLNQATHPVAQSTHEHARAYPSFARNFSFFHSSVYSLPNTYAGSVVNTPCLYAFDPSSFLTLDRTFVRRSFNRELLFSFGLDLACVQLYSVVRNYTNSLSFNRRC